MGLGQMLRTRASRTRWSLTVVCVCVACVQSSTGTSAAAWVAQSALAPALVANGDLSSVSCVRPAPCVAVGYFVSASGVDRPLIEIHRGRHWSIQAGPVSSGARDTRLNAVACPARRRCIAVGYSVLATGAKVTFAERWKGSSWSIQRTIDPMGAGGQLSGLSCPSAGFCMAVGSGPRGALAERWNGSHWSLQRLPRLGAGGAGQLDGVSCLSRFSCLAVGATRPGAVADRWNGRRWSRLRGPQRVGGLSAVSCTSPQACSAIADSNLVERWNGRWWMRQNVPRPSCDPSAFCSTVLSSITCVSPSACYLAGAFDAASGGSSGAATGTPVGEFWDGSRWRAERVKAVAVCLDSVSELCGTTLHGISCAARAVCVVVGTSTNAAGVGQPLIEHRTSGAWSVQPTSKPLGPVSSQLTSVSCSSATACTAVGSYTDAIGSSFLLAERWNGATWTIQQTPGTGRFNGVSCPSATQCFAIGATASFPAVGMSLAETWNGTTWTRLQAPVASALSAVSCTSTTSCLAVGQATSGSTLTEIWNGTTWTVQPSADAGSWLGLSCASADACLAARADPTSALADSWDGTSWTALPQPQPQFNPFNPFYSAVSCPAINACTIVVNNLIPGQFQSSLEALAFRWDGATWSTRQIQLPPGEDVNTIGGVSCPSATTCTAVGSYSFVLGDGPESIAPLLERWNGTTWNAQPPPSPYQLGGAQLNAVSCASTTTCTAVGEGSTVFPTGYSGTVVVYTAPVALSYS